MQLPEKWNFSSNSAAESRLEAMAIIGKMLLFCKASGQAADSSGLCPSICGEAVLRHPPIPKCFRGSAALFAMRNSLESRLQLTAASPEPLPILLSPGRKTARSVFTACPRESARNGDSITTCLSELFHRVPEPSLARNGAQGFLGLLKCFIEAGKAQF